LSEELARFKKLEEEGRQRAMERDSLPKGDSEFLSKMEEAAREMSNYFAPIGEEAFARFANRLSDVASMPRTRVWHCESEGKRRSDCDMSSLEPDVAVLDTHFGNTVTIGPKRCSFLRGEVDPYNLSSMLNDLTACFHRGIEKFEETATTWHKEGKCMWKVK
jgi:hypothetical protein